MKTLAKITLDNETNERADIVYDDGRIHCDGHDITPCPYKISEEQAREDIEEMYYAPQWDLEFVD